MEATRNQKTITNKYAGACRFCGSNVPAGTGQAVKLDEGWKTQHLACAEPGCQPQPEAAAVAAPAFAPTPEQVAAIHAYATGDDLVLQAGAGAGKTSTLKLIAAHAKDRGLRIQYTAFNRAIVDDTADSMPSNVTCSTMHSLAFRAIGRIFAHRLNSNRQTSDQIARQLGIREMTINEHRLAAGWLAAKVMGAIRRFCSSEDAEIGRQHFAYIDGLDLPDEAGNKTFDGNDELAARLLPFARQAWTDLTDPAGSLRFSHDIYLKLWQLGSPRISADIIMLDEAQDADPVQVSIIEQQRQHGTQIIVVGDEQQVIYEWRGAVDALARFEAMGARVAMLTQSFRFGPEIAAIANGLLARNNARLQITGAGSAGVVGPIDTPDAILCRSNAGAVTALLSAIGAGIRPFLVGGGAEVISFCEAAEKLQAGQSTSHPELACFLDWAAVEAYVESDDQGSDLKLMVKLINKFGARKIIDALRSCPREADADLVISTAHKSKGREWNRVQLGSDFMPPEEGELSASELRLAYVACTRAKRELDIEATPHFGLEWKAAR